MARRLRLLLALLAVWAAVPLPATAHGNAAIPPVSSLFQLLPDCRACPELNPRPPGPDFLKLALHRPDRYTPWETYPMSVEAVPFRGGETRFLLFADQGGFASGDPDVAVNNSAGGSFVTYRRPYAGPANSPAVWNFNWTAPANGSGPVNLYLLVVNGPGESAPKGNAWFEGQATLWVGSDPTPLPTVPSEWASPSPAPRSPGFGAAAALGALGAAWVFAPRRRP